MIKNSLSISKYIRNVKKVYLFSISFLSKLQSICGKTIDKYDDDDKKNAVNMAEQTSDGQDKRSDLMYLQSVFLSFKTLSFSFTPSPRFYYALIIVFLSFNRDEKKTNYY